MSQSKNVGMAELIALVVISVPLIVVASGVGWYRASAQADVYRREGIEMSTWEAFIGCRPAERTVNLK